MCAAPVMLTGHGWKQSSKSCDECGKGDADKARLETIKQEL